MTTNPTPTKEFRTMTADLSTSTAFSKILGRCCDEATAGRFFAVTPFLRAARMALAAS